MDIENRLDSGTGLIDPDAANRHRRLPPTPTDYAYRRRQRRILDAMADPGRRRPPR